MSGEQSSGTLRKVGLTASGMALIAAAASGCVERVSGTALAHEVAATQESTTPTSPPETTTTTPPPPTTSVPNGPTVYTDICAHYETTRMQEAIHAPVGEPQMGCSSIADTGEVVDHAGSLITGAHYNEVLMVLSDEQVGRLTLSGAQVLVYDDRSSEQSIGGGPASIYESSKVLYSDEALSDRNPMLDECIFLPGASNPAPQGIMCRIGHIANQRASGIDILISGNDMQTVNPDEPRVTLQNLMAEVAPALVVDPGS